MPELGEELRRAMDDRSRWNGSVDGLWQRVRESLSPSTAGARGSHAYGARGRGARWARGRAPAWAALGLAAALVLGVGLAKTGLLWHAGATPGTSAGQVEAPGTGGIKGGPEIIIPTMSGVVGSISDGQVHLTGVEYSLPHDFNGTKPGPDLPLPPGRWVTSTHWQSDRDTLDLFLGEHVVFFITAKTIAPDMELTRPGSPTPDAAVHLDFYYAVVKDVQPDRLTIVKYAPSGTNQWGRPDGEVTLRVAPYSFRGMTKEELPKVGDRAIIGWFGDSTDQIVWQYAVTGR